MPSAKELQRGIRLGVYRDVEKEQRDERRVQVAERRIDLADQREVRIADIEGEKLRLAKAESENKLAKDAATTKLQADILEQSTAATKKLASINPRSDDYETQRQALKNEFSLAFRDPEFNDQIGWNDGRYKDYFADKQAGAKLAEQRRYDEAKKAEEKQALADARKQSIEGLSKMGGKLKSATITATGEVAPVVDFTGEAKPELDARKLAQARYENALKLRMQPGLAKALASDDKKVKQAALDQATYLDQEMTASKSLLAPPAAPQAQPATPGAAPAVTAPERTATNPQTGAKLAFRNGKWEPL